MFNTNKTLEQKVKASMATSLHFIEHSIIIRPKGPYTPGWISARVIRQRFSTRFLCSHQAIFADDEPSEHANSFPDIRWRLM